MLRQSEARGTYRLEHRSKQSLNKGKETAKRIINLSLQNKNKPIKAKVTYFKRRFSKGNKPQSEELIYVLACVAADSFSLPVGASEGACLG